MNQRESQTENAGGKKEKKTQRRIHEMRNRRAAEWDEASGGVLLLDDLRLLQYLNISAGLAN